MIRAAQAVYDVWLDLTGVTVGRYRRTVFLLLAMTHVLLGWGFEPATRGLLCVPAAWLLWLCNVHAHFRASEDDVDQAAGRYTRVNARALSSAASLVPVLGVTVAIDVALWALLLVVDHGISTILWGPTFVAAFSSVFVNECILVRERDPDRFRLESPARAAHDAA